MRSIATYAFPTKALEWRDHTLLIWDLKDLSRGRMEWLWRELSGNDAADAIHAVRAMKSTPAESVAFLHERLRPAPPPEPDVTRLVADLDNDDFRSAKRRQWSWRNAVALSRRRCAKPTRNNRRRRRVFVWKACSPNSRTP
jgi:hypothetical protein